MPCILHWPGIARWFGLDWCKHDSDSWAIINLIIVTLFVLDWCNCNEAPLSAVSLLMDGFGIFPSLLFQEIFELFLVPLMRDASCDILFGFLFCNFCRGGWKSKAVFRITLHTSEICCTEHCGANPISGQLLHSRMLLRLNGFRVLSRSHKKWASWRENDAETWSSKVPRLRLSHQFSSLHESVV